MIQRLYLNDLKEILQIFPAAMLTGPRQVGKTTLAKQISGLINKPVRYLDLEKLEDRNILLNDAQGYLSRLKDHCVIIDEAQVIPEIFTWLRPLIDEDRSPGRFILLGSANPALVKGVSETLAGRVIYLEIGQINLTEALGATIEQERHWFRGGFPDALLAKSDKAWNLWTGSFVSAYIQRDLNFLFGIDLTPETIKRIWSMIAHMNSGIENAENLGRSLGITGATVKKYLDFLQGAYLINRLPAWYVNSKKRLVKSPKLYLRTTGILHFLLNIPDWDALQGHPAIGGSWEAYVLEQIYQLKPPQTSVYYYRTHNGAEADIVLVKGINPVACLEIKYSNAPTISRGFHESISDLGTDKNFVITPGSDRWTTKDGTIVCSLKEFIAKDLSSL
ncbi:MAG: ATP-binding protein [Cytophagaceae bacterium]|nr:ATP-binding protein [Cytophagaceae bacterium]